MAVTVKIMTIPGAPLEGTNPLPKFHSKNEADVKTAPDYPEGQPDCPELFLSQSVSRKHHAHARAEQQSKTSIRQLRSQSKTNA